MTQPDASQRTVSHPGYIPKQFNSRSRARFLKSRREQHLSRVAGPPSDTQIAMVQSLATLEWAALSAEDDGTLRALREAREHRRLHLQVLRDFEKTLGPTAPKGGVMTTHPSASAPSTAAETLSQGVIRSEPVEPELPLFPSTRRAKRYRDHRGAL